MHCDGCNNSLAARVQIKYINDQKIEICDSCGASPFTGIPDIYLEPGGGERTNENICDDNGTPIPYSSKREKARIMKERGLKQAECAEFNKGHRSDSYTKRTYYTFK